MTQGEKQQLEQYKRDIEAMLEQINLMTPEGVDEQTAFQDLQDSLGDATDSIDELI